MRPVVCAYVHTCVYVAVDKFTDASVCWRGKEGIEREAAAAAAAGAAAEEAKKAR